MLARKAIVREHSGAAFEAREIRRPLAVGLGEIAHAHRAIAQRQC